MSVLLGEEHTPSPGSLKHTIKHTNLYMFLHLIDMDYSSTRGLTSTCIQSLCFSQTSAMRSSGSNAPCTVVPDVQLTRKGTAPWWKQTKCEHSCLVLGAFCFARRTIRFTVSNTSLLKPIQVTQNPVIL